MQTKLLKDMRHISTILRTLVASAFLVTITGLVAPSTTNAATEPCPNGQKQLVDDQASSRTCCPENTELNATNCFFAKYITPAINVLTALVGVVVVVSIIAGGIQYSASGADPSKVGAAKKRITNAILALIGFIFLSAMLQWLIPGGAL